MPVNITLGSPVEFIADFHTQSGSAVTPSAASVTVNYPTATTMVSSVIAMSQTANSRWTATWYSSNSVLGFAVWAVSGVSTSLVNPGATGDIKLV